MKFTSICLENFRCFERRDFRFDAPLQLLMGPNGSGKSNLIEAMAIVAGRRSSRQSLLKDEAVRWHTPQYTIHAELVDDLGERWTVGAKHNLKGSTRMLVNGKPVRRLSEWMGRVPMVILLPEDIQIFSGPSAQRRQWLDQILCQLYPDYWNALGSYTRALQHRNRALNQQQWAEAGVFLNELLLHAFHLHRIRRLFIEEISPRLDLTMTDIFQFPSVLGLHYRMSGPKAPVAREDMEQYFDTWSAYFHERQMAERSLGYTVAGPHRDDISLLFDEDRDLRIWGSFGQRRAAALALKWTELQLIENARHERAIVLLDEALHGLDEVKERRVLDLFVDGRQVFWTGNRFSQVILQVAEQKNHETSWLGIVGGMSTQEGPLQWQDSKPLAR